MVVKGEAGMMLLQRSRRLQPPLDLLHLVETERCRWPSCELRTLPDLLHCFMSYAKGTEEHNDEDD